jgi:radical SAM superfamily enzyme YgiQ (UPF0313 family)
MIIYSVFVIKKNNPNIDIMVGGIQILTSKSTEEIFNALDVVDYVLTGDIEVAIEKYLNNSLSNKNYFVGHTNMEKIGTPEYYKAEIWIDNFILVNTSRSCPYNCSFCSGAIEKVRQQPVDVLINTISTYNKLFLKCNIKIYFTDNTFNLNKKRINDVCDGLISINNQIPLEAYLVYNHIDHQIIRKMNKANFKVIRLGLDAFAEEKRQFANKNFNITREQIIDVADCISSNGMENQIFFIFGMPNETPESFNIDFNLVKELRRREGVNVFPFFYGLVSGSDIYNNPSKYNVKFEYWKTKPCVVSDINNIIQRTPKFYYCDVTPDQYVDQFKTLRPILSNDDGYKSTTLELEKLMKEHLL